MPHLGHDPGLAGGAYGQIPKSGMIVIKDLFRITLFKLFSDPELFTVAPVPSRVLPLDHLEPSSVEYAAGVR